MKIAKLFKNGQSQAVRLPKEFRFSGNTVYVKKLGSTLVLLPTDHPWESLFNSLQKFTPEFMENREQPDEQIREDF